MGLFPRYFHFLIFPALALSPLARAAEVSATTGSPAKAVEKAAVATKKATTAQAWAAISAPIEGESQVIGSYAGGCFRGGVEIPLSTPYWEVVNPHRRRHYGHPDALEILQRVGAWARPRIGKMVIGDISQPAGGPLPYGHASHQAGLDIDVRFNLVEKNGTIAEKDHFPFNDVAVHALKTEGTTAVLDSRILGDRWKKEYGELVRRFAEEEGVERIFISPPIKKKLCKMFAPKEKGDAYPSWLLKVRPYYGHSSHFHVRLACPKDSPQCRPQGRVRADANDDTRVGCGGSSLAWWMNPDPKTDGFLQQAFAAAKPVESKPAESPTPVKIAKKFVPAACLELLPSLVPPPPLPAPRAAGGVR